MFTLHTPRLILTATPLEVIKTRLRHDDFMANVRVLLEREGQHDVESLRVHFPPEWPGDAIALLPIWEEKLETDSGYEMWGGTMVDRVALTAVGQMTLLPIQDQPGTAELGYGVNPGYQGRGYATEVTRALVKWTEGEPGIRRITAASLEENVASRRVLEKAGFRRVGHRQDQEGRMILWERSC